MHTVGLARINDIIVPSMRKVITTAGLHPVPIEFPNEQLTEELSVVVLSTTAPIGDRMKDGQVRSRGEYFGTIYEIVRLKAPHARVILATQHTEIAWLEKPMQSKCADCKVVPVSFETLYRGDIGENYIIPVFRHCDIKVVNDEPETPDTFNCAVQIMQTLARFSNQLR